MVALFAVLYVTVAALLALAMAHDGGLSEADDTDASLLFALVALWGPIAVVAGAILVVGLVLFGFAQLARRVGG
jgi:hypothetical protein